MTETTEIKVVFTKADDYKLVPVAGVWGGLSPQGDVIADFFVDKRELPDSMTLKVKEGGGKPEEVDRMGGENITREMQVGIVLRPEEAYSIGAWLIEKARIVGLPGETSKGNSKPSEESADV